MSKILRAASVGMILSSMACTGSPTDPSLVAGRGYQLVRINDVPIDQNQNACGYVKQILVEVLTARKDAGTMVVYTTTQVAGQSFPSTRVDSLTFSQVGNTFTIPDVPNGSGGRFTILDDGRRLLGSRFACHPRMAGIIPDIATNLEFRAIE